MSIKDKKINLLLFFFLVNISLIFSQGFSVPHFENTNTFYGLDGKPYINADSQLFLKLRMEPSNKFYFDMSIDANIDRLIDFFSPAQDPKFNGNFRFLGASFNFPKIQNHPISFAIFTGIYDTLGSDSILQEHLKVKMPDPEFRRYHPASAFRPRNFVEGTGFSFYGAFSSGFYLGTYLAWNEKLEDKLQIKSDFRMGGTFDFFTFDFFAGAAFQKNIAKTKLRTGLAMLLWADDDYDFFTEIGIAEIKVENMTMKDFTSNFYASFEARIKKDMIKSSIACFVSPVFLLPQSINDPLLKDSFFTGVSADIRVGNIETKNMEGGIHLMGTVNPLKPTIITPFSFLISPFYTIRANDFTVDFRLPINPLLYKNISKMITAQISIKAVY